MKKLYLVDVSSLFFRAFYAVRPLTNASGMQVNALYGFLSMTIKLLREIRPEYLAFCFDRKEATFRVEIDPNYKANRTEMPPDLAVQIPYIRRLSEALGISCYDQMGFEADDLIGSLTEIGRGHQLEVVIVSGDKDFAQLVRPHVSLYDTMKEARIDEAGVLEKWGVEPGKMIDYLALVGDSSDNVPGVMGIGAKGASKLLHDFSSLEDLYQNLDRVPSASLRAKLEAGKADAFLSKRLVTIVTDMPLQVAVDDLRLKPIDRDNLTSLLQELDFKSFAKTLLGNESNPAPPAMPVVEAASETSAALQVVETGSADFGPIATSRMNATELAKWLKPQVETWVIDTERGVLLAQKHASWSVVEVAASSEEMNEILHSGNVPMKGFDIKTFCKNHKVRAPQVVWDQMLAAYVIRAGQIEQPGPLFTLYNGMPLPELPSPAQLLSAHLMLEVQLRRKLTSIGGEKVLFTIEQPLVPILLAMETTGIHINRDLLAEQSRSLAADLAVLEKKIHQSVGMTFNIGSPKQLGQVLFEKMKMPTGKKTKTGFSTDNEVLEKLQVEFPIVGDVLQWRELSKLKSTYVDALPQLADSEGRVHTTFNQAWTATGRLSSLNPNLQNIPIRTERGNAIRKAFTAGQGYQFLSADYSQIELRILAQITSDPGLTNAFESGVDIHAATAAEVFGVRIGEVTPEMRRKAKAVNFGLAYGQGAFGLAETLRISRGEATEIINRYFARFSGVKTYMTETVEEAKKKGYVETAFGRRRYLDELFSKSPQVRKFGERAAINAPIQGTASDLIKLAMIKVGIPKNTKPLLQVHDELVLEVPDSEVKEVSDHVTQAMKGAAHFRIPLEVNVGVGRNWYDAHS